VSVHAEHVSYRGLFANREFGALVVAFVTSGVGDQVARVAIALAVLENTNSAFYAVMAFAVSYVPSIFGAALLGPLADRMPRRRLMLVCDLARAVAIGVLAFLPISTTSLVVIFGLLFITELFSPPFDAAWAATMPEILRDSRQYMVGSGLIRTLHLVLQVVGLLAGGVVVAVLSVSWALALDSASFAVSFLLILFFLQKRSAAIVGGEGLRGFFRDLREGADDLAHEPARRMLVLVGWGSAVVIVAAMASGLPYATEVGRSATEGSLLMAAALAGSSICAMVMSAWPPLRQVDATLPLMAGSCLPMVAVAFKPPFGLAVLMWFLCGLMTGFIVPLVGNVALMTAPDRRGRVIALAGAGYNAIVALVFLLTGYLADVKSAAFAASLAGTVGLIIVFISLIAWPTDAMHRELRAAHAAQNLLLSETDDRGDSEHEAIDGERGERARFDPTDEKGGGEQGGQERGDAAREDLTADAVAEGAEQVGHLDKSGSQNHWRR
jgi:MFS family permease